MYDRTYDGQALTFEPSGGLLEAALVMRDRETDSWWAIMQGRAICGPKSGQILRELPGAEKTTWGDWRRRHPDTRVLMVGDQTHVPRNQYENYFTSDKTFRGLRPADDRLPAKEPVFAFRLEGRAFAVPHGATEGGVLWSPVPAGKSDESIPTDDVFLFRERGASVFASTRAWVLPRGLASQHQGEYVVRTRDGEVRSVDGLSIVRTLESMENGHGVRLLSGMDTYWYTWITVNPETTVLP